MTEQEYQEYIKVRSQLSYLDRVRVAEYELAQVLADIKTLKERIDNLGK